MAVATNYHLGGYLPAAPQQNRKEVFDGPANLYTSWDTAGVQTSQRALTGVESTALAAQDTANTTSTNKATLLQQAQTALAGNRAYITAGLNVTPQDAQILALTRQINKLILLVIDKTDVTS